MEAYFAFLEPLILWSASIIGKKLSCTYAVRKVLYSKKIQELILLFKF